MDGASVQECVPYQEKVTGTNYDEVYASSFSGFSSRSTAIANEWIEIKVI